MLKIKSKVNANKNGYVYCWTSEYYESKNIYKIGYTTMTVKKRLSGMTELLEEPILKFEIFSENAKKLE